MRVAIGVLLSVILPSCGTSSNSAPAAATPSPLAAHCTHQLTPRSVARPPLRLEPPIAARASRLIVHAKLSLAKLGAELEQNIAPRLADGSGIKLGPAGRLDYSVDRGAF